MQITSVQNTQNYTQNTQKVNSSNTTNKASFGEVLGATQKEEKRYESKFLQFLGEGALDKFSEEKKRLFEDILSDDKITMSEIENLNYKDTKELLNFVWNSYSNENGIVKDTPFVQQDSQVQDIWGASNLTNDEAFNEAYANIMRDPNLDDNQRDRISFEMQQQMTQSYFNKDLEISTVASLNPKASSNPLEMDKDKIDIDVFFDRVFNMLDNWLSKTDIVPSLRKDAEFLKNTYGDIYENYQKIKNRPTQIYV